MKRRASLAVGLLVAGLVGNNVVLAQRPEPEVARTIAALDRARPLATESLPRAVSRPLRSLDPHPPLSPKDTLPPAPATIPLDMPHSDFVDPALQDDFGTTQSPPVKKSWDGIRQMGTGAPPDPVGDVGPHHYVQAVNGAFAVWSKSGRLRFGPASLSSLWAGIGGPCRNLGKGDPIIQYDALAKRWFISEFAFEMSEEKRPVGPFYQCIAVSKTSDPMGRYHLYPFLVSRHNFPDYPKFGVWPDGYYMTVHLFDPGSAEYEGQGIFVFDRNNMLSGRAAHAPVGISNPSFYGVLPADVDGTKPPPAGAPNYLLAVEDNGSGFRIDQLELFEFRVEWNNHGTSRLVSVAALPTAAFDTNLCYGNTNCIPQLGVTRRLDALGDGVLMYRLAYRNFGSHQSLVLNHVVDVDGTDHAGIRWYEIRAPGPDAQIYQQGTYAPDARHRWMGSIAMDRSGNIAMGYSMSGVSAFPSIQFTGRLDGDALGEMTMNEAYMVQGGGSQTGSSRWGDYSSMSVDPSDGCTFWYTQEYYASTSADGWRTRIGSFRFRSCGPKVKPGPDGEPQPQPSEAPAPAPAGVSGEGSSSDGSAPQITAVRDAPDPFSPNGDGVDDTARVSFSLSKTAMVTVTIKDRRGKVVRRIAHTRLTPGNWFADWNGRRALGKPSPAGTFAYIIRAVDDGGNVAVEEGTVTLQR
ncbi:MAG TPA: gliding motility-associated C-terminal domain-containing protein [Actinomycetota bacterium]|nr:gliding motility-associated C-terminal domain-containing protein [Actinomycetota bacterium]